MEPSKRCYKWCFVPMCTNTTFTTPEKTFLTMPRDVKIRKMWFKAARRDYSKITSSDFYCCEDHFDVKIDLLCGSENWPNWKVRMIRLLKLKHKEIGREIRSEVGEMDVNQIVETMVVNRILNTLPTEYFEFKDTLSVEDRKLSNLVERLRLKEISIKQKCTSSSEAFFSNQKCKSGNNDFNTIIDPTNYEAQSNENEICNANGVGTCMKTSQKKYLCRVPRTLGTL
ncbi:hypothetical protein RI129_000828 [Pyrocoelia pectoralis]|uniref:THAP-type domain-containing protein n=1 Tax=Pyrocoelia pectoralis TaxID=417401 RepID=A0AAN7VU65_9COLE